MFRASSAHLQEDIVLYKQHMVTSLSIRVPGGLSVHSLSVYRQATTNSDNSPHRKQATYTKGSPKERRRSW